MKYRYTATYLQKHPIEAYSAAMIMQDQIVRKEDWDEIERESYGADWDRLRSEYRQESADGLFRLMRCDGSKVCHFLVVEAVLEREEEMLPIIKRRLLTTCNEFFVEAAARFLADCKENCAQWILAHYGEVRSPFMQSALCLILGLRADLSVADFLFREVEGFERMYPDEMYEQGPLLGLDNLEVRYGRF